ncbi:hypothetical protein AUP68_11386 [Ilyonectria robusta]
MLISTLITVPPWHSRLPIACDLDLDMAMETASRMEGILVATSASEKAGKVGMGGIVRDTLGNRPGEVVARYSITVGSRDDQNVYTAELEAIAMALRCMPDGLQHRELTVITSSRSALEVIAQPRQQSGQCTVKEIHKHAERLQKSGNIIKMLWVPSKDRLSDGLRSKGRSPKSCTRKTQTEESSISSSFYTDETGNRTAATAEDSTQTCAHKKEACVLGLPASQALFCQCEWVSKVDLSGRLLPSA